MRTRIPAFLLSLVCLAPPAGAGQAPAPAPDIRTLEVALARGLVDKDRAALDALLAPDFVLRGRPDVDRVTWLDNAVSLCWGDEATIDDFSIVSLGDAVVATFTLTTYRHPTTCEPAIVRSVITDLWRPVGGAWRLALRQSGPGGTHVTGQAAITEPPPPRWEATGELSFVSTSGNTSTGTLGAGGDVTNRAGVWLTKGHVAFVRAETGGKATARSLGLGARVSRDLTPRAGLFAHAAYLRDTFAGIEHRVGVDGGIAWKLVAAAPHTVDLDAGVGYTSETRLAEDDRSFATGTLALAYRWALNDAAEIANDAGFTANLQDGPDWRFTDTVAVSASLNRTLSLELSYQVKHLNRPVPGFEKTDTIASAAIVAKFAR